MHGSVSLHTRFLALGLTWLLPAAGVLAQAPTFVTHPVSEELDGAIDCAMADLDLDGDVDLGAVAFDSDTVVWYENDGSENFTEHLLGTPDGPRSMLMVGPDGAPLDLDGDGDVDLVVAVFNDRDILWYENDGAMNFTVHTVDGNLGGAHTAVAGDLDGDGDLDLAATSYNAVWYENDGSQNFTLHNLKTHPHLGCSMQIVDFDLDGDLDLFEVIEGTWINVIWWENDGVGGFTEHDLVGSLDSAHTGFAADMDADGAMELVTAAGGTGRYSVWDAPFGSFVERFFDNSCTANYWIEPADLDGDGDLDLVAASTGCGVLWFEQTGSYTYTKFPVDDTFAGAYCARAGDIDGDGDLDVLAASRAGDALIWCEQVALSSVAGPDGGLPGAGAGIQVTAAPNPFNPQTTISYEVPQPGRARVEIVDLRGRIRASLVDRELVAGAHNVTWRPRNLPSGSYFCRVSTGQGSVSRKITLMK